MCHDALFYVNRTNTLILPEEFDEREKIVSICLLFRGFRLSD